MGADVIGPLQGDGCARELPEVVETVGFGDVDAFGVGQVAQGALDAEAEQVAGRESSTGAKGTRGLRDMRAQLTISRARGRRVRSCRQEHDERGFAVIEAAVGVTAFGLFVSLIVMGGRIETAHQAVQSAAYDAARAASISRTQTEASSQAMTAAIASLRNQQLECVASRVSVDTRGFRAPLGTPAAVRATVTCRISLSDLALPGVPGNRTISATMRSPLDTYRERR